MYKIIKTLALAIVLAGSMAFSINAQTETKVIVNSDGSYSVIEYPMDKDVELRLLPMKGINGNGMARVLRTANGTKVVFNVSGAPADWKDVYAYSVDPTGTSTLLGPITFADGTGRGEFMTKGDRFMIVLSPSDSMTAYDSTTSYVYRSDVPSGYTVVPRIIRSDNEAMVMSAADVTTATYDVPLLNIPQYMGKTTALRLNFTGDLSGLEAKAYIKPVAGKTQIKMNFDDMQKVPTGKRFILWTSGPTGYTKIGQVIHAGKKDTAKITGESSLNDFGLFLTVEDSEVDRPTSRVYSTFKIVAP